MLRGFLIKLTALDGQLEDIKRELIFFPLVSTAEKTSLQRKLRSPSSSRRKTTLSHPPITPRTA